jgi:hypothetical protein
MPSRKFGPDAGEIGTGGRKVRKKVTLSKYVAHMRSDK